MRIHTEVAFPYSYKEVLPGAYSSGIWDESLYVATISKRRTVCMLCCIMICISMVLIYSNGIWDDSDYI